MTEDELYNHISSTIFIRAVRNSLKELTPEDKQDIANQALDDADLFMIELRKRKNPEARSFIGS